MRIGIFGYGKLGRAVEIMSKLYGDIELSAIFTRRQRECVKSVFANVYHESEIYSFKDKIDCLLICQGSAKDLPIYTPRLAKSFSVVDSYDNHTKIKEHKSACDISAKAGGNTAIISCGWDPGLLSVLRLLLNSFMPYSKVHTFWGRGVSQGHSEAIKGIDGVKYAIEYTVPKESAVTLASLTSLELSEKDKYKRVCYVVAQKDRDRIYKEITEMPGYFLGYDTEVYFITEAEFLNNHNAKYHRGRVIAHGVTGLYGENCQSASVDLSIGSNPEFTACIMLSLARVCAEYKKEGYYGAFTLFDIPLSRLIDSADYYRLI